MNFFKKKQNLIMVVIIAIIAVIVIGVGVKIHNADNTVDVSSSTIEQEGSLSSEALFEESEENLVYVNGVLQKDTSTPSDKTAIIDDENDTDNDKQDIISNEGKTEGGTGTAGVKNETAIPPSTNSNAGTESNTSGHGGSNSTDNSSNSGSNSSNSGSNSSNSGNNSSNSNSASNGNTGNSDSDSNNSGSNSAGNNTSTPVQPEDDTITVYVTIRCDTILNNMDKLKEGKASYVPSSGYIMSKKAVTVEEGTSAFDVTKKVCANAGIQIEYSWTPAYNTYYVEGINHLYEFDCGGDSGWMYKVNGVFPNYGCSQYEVKDGDHIVWCYTCEGLGADVGATY